VDLLVLADSPSHSDREEGGVAGSPFANIRMAAVPGGGPPPHAAEVLRRIEGYPADRLRLLEGLETLSATAVDVINLSLGPPGLDFDPMEPLQIATARLVEMGILVVVAAGNHGPEPDTLGQLARAPWVVSVGATDAAGALANRSSRGTSGGPCPSFVCDGTNTLDPSMEPATSFASPRAAFMACWVKGAFDLIAADMRQAVEGTWDLLSQPVELPVVGFADTAWDPDAYDRARTISQEFYDKVGSDAMQLAHRDSWREWYERVGRVVRDAGIETEPRTTPQVLKRVLESAAREIPSRSIHEVGRGFLSLAEVQEFLGSLTPTTLARVFAVDGEVPETWSALRSLDEELGPLWEPNDGMVLVTKELFHRGYRAEHVEVAT
jgi:hypothetical protein